MLHIRDDQMKQLAAACNTMFIEDTVSELRLLFPTVLGAVPRSLVVEKATEACRLFQSAGFVYLQQLYRLIGYELLHGPEFWRQLPEPVGTQMFDVRRDAYERFSEVRDFMQRKERNNWQRKDA